MCSRAADAAVVVVVVVQQAVTSTMSCRAREQQPSTRSRPPCSWHVAVVAIRVVVVVAYVAVVELDVHLYSDRFWNVCCCCCCCWTPLPLPVTWTWSVR